MRGSEPHGGRFFAGFGTEVSVLARLERPAGLGGGVYNGRMESSRGVWPVVRKEDIAAAGLIVAGSLLLITFLHYSTLPNFRQLHAVYRYFYFLPIVYAALRFGFWGGLGAALVASLLFAPHIIFKWGSFPEDGLNDLLVVVVFYGVAVITGRTVDRLRRAEMRQSEMVGELEQSLQRLAVQSEELRRAERLSALGLLAGGLAHEIRNPVGIIRAGAQLLAMEVGAEAEETAAVIQQETDRIETLIQELLDYAGGERLQRERVDVGAALGGRGRPRQAAHRLRRRRTGGRGRAGRGRGVAGCGADGAGAGEFVHERRAGHGRAGPSLAARAAHAWVGGLPGAARGG